MSFDYQAQTNKAMNNFNNAYRGSKLKMLSAKNGGSIIDLISKADASKTPTIIVGLGGLGGKTVNLIKKKYIENINDPEGRIQFLALDVDEKSMADLKFSRDNGYLKDDEIGNILVDETGCARILWHLLNDKVVNPAQKWVDRDFDSTIVIDRSGARGMRQLGRLMLSNRLDHENVENLITRKLENIPARTSFTVILIAGISGGTGSGTVVDVSYLIRNMARERLGNQTLRFDAIFFTPDVQQDVRGVEPDRLRRNFVAAMKEVDSFFKITNTNSEYNFPCERNTDGKLPVGRENLFDSVTLVQGYDDTGRVMDIAVPVESVANYVINGIGDYSTKDDNGNITGTFQTLTSVLSNEQSNKDNHVGRLLNNRPSLPGDSLYEYRAIGFNTISFPIEEIATIVANSAMMKINEKFQAHYTGDKYAVLSLANIANVRQQNGVWEEAKGEAKYWKLFLACGLNPNAADSIIDSFQKKKDIKEKAISSILSTLASNRTRANIEWTGTSISAITTEIKTEMRKNGPYAAIRFSTDILDYIDSQISIAPKVEAALNKKANDGENALRRLHNEISNAGFFDSANGKIQEFKAACRDYSVTKSKLNLHSTVKEALEDLRTKLIEIHNNQWQYFTGAFCALADVLKTDSTAAMNTSVNYSAGQQCFSVSLLNLEDLRDVNSNLGKFVNSILKQGYIDELCSKLIDSMLENEEAWSADVNSFNGVEKLKEIFKNKFTVFTKNVIEKFLIIQYADLSSHTIDELLDAMDAFKLDEPDPVKSDQCWIQFENYCTGNLGMTESPVDMAAKAIYRAIMNVGQCAAESEANGTVTFNDFYNISMVCLIESMPHINKKITNLMVNAGLKPPVTGKFPGIYHLEVYCGLPLYLFKGMEINQRIYSDSIKAGGRDNAGMHMDASKEAGWRDFPPLINNNALELIFPNNPSVRKNVDYNSEEIMLSNIKKKTDICLENGFFDLFSENGTPRYYSIKKVESSGNELDVCRTNLLNSYRTQVQGIVANMQEPIPAGSNQPEADWLSSFEKAYTAVPVMQLMEANGYEIVAEDLNLSSIYLKMDHVSTGDFHDVDGGGLYKTIRRSQHFREELDRCYEECSHLLGELEKIKQEIINTEIKKALSVYNNILCKRILKLFVNAFLTGHISFTHEIDNQRMFMYFYEFLDKKQVSVTWAEGSMMNSGEYERKYSIYGAFCEFYKMVLEQGVKWMSEFENEVNDELNQMADNGTITPEVKRNMIKFLCMDITSLENVSIVEIPCEDFKAFNFDTISFPVAPPNKRVFCAKEINDEAREVSPLKFKNMGTLPFSDENNEISNSIAGQIMVFYNELQNVK